MAKSSPKTIHTLKQEIATSRQRLMNLWDARGFTDADVLAASIELDELLNIYHKLQSQNHAWPN